MAVAISLLALFGIVMLVWNVSLTHECSASQRLLDEVKERQRREIARLEDRSHALELQLQLRRRKPPKRPPTPDPATVKRRVIDAAARAFDEAMGT